MRDGEEFTALVSVTCQGITLLQEKHQMKMERNGTKSGKFSAVTMRCQQFLHIITYGESPNYIRAIRITYLHLVRVAEILD